jgi:hypothetical protein
MSPAPRDLQSNTFSNAIRSHPRIVEDWPTHDDKSACVWAVNNQLLVARSVSPAPPKNFAITADGKRLVSALGDLGLTATFVTSLFSGVPKVNTAVSEDIDLVLLKRKDGKPLGPQEVFKRVNQIRNDAKLSLPPRSVAPNHVLVPAWNGDGCPYGPPREYAGTVPPKLPPAAVPKGPHKPKITLIDSGYVWKQKKWGANPLDKLLGHAQTYPTPGWWPDETAPGGWTRCPRDEVDARNPSNPTRLDALAGHANFVGGVLARRSWLPTLNIWNHNGSFVADETLAHVTTEIAVLKSLLASQQAEPTQVIMFVYAFPPFEGVLSVAWDSTMRQLLENYNNNFVLVCPAGNQGTTQRRYPAALATVDPIPFYKAKSSFASSGKSSGTPAVATSANRPYANVIGVGSLDVTGHTASDFTNRGAKPQLGHPADPWLTCSAIGEHVKSSFLRVNLPPEEQPRPAGTAPSGHDFAAHKAWAEWQGTCFSAPKIVAAIANELQSDTDSATAAWQSVQTKLSPSRDPQLGLMFGKL